jgi:hypothetical protein
LDIIQDSGEILAKNGTPQYALKAATIGILAHGTDSMGTA